MPGSSGKPRDRLGEFDRTVHKGAVTFPIPDPVMHYDDNGIRTGATFEIHLDSGYNMDRFRRALHHIAFNSAALNYGVEAAFDLKYDRVRNYVRSPQRKERWPFVQIRADPTRSIDVPRVAHEKFDKPTPDVEIVTMEIMSGVWMVDLLNSGLLLTTQSDEKTTQVIGPDWRPSKRPPADPTKRYRVSIY